MPSPVFNTSFLSQAIQYTGSNSADILAQVPNVTFQKEVGGVLTLIYNGSPVTVETTDWVIFDVNGVNSLPNTLFLAERDCIPICSELEALADRVLALENAARGTA